MFLCTASGEMGKTYFSKLTSRGSPGHLQGYTSRVLQSCSESQKGEERCLHVPLSLFLIMFVPRPPFSSSLSYCSLSFPLLIFLSSFSASTDTHCVFGGVSLWLERKLFRKRCIFFTQEEVLQRVETRAPPPSRNSLELSSSTS